MKEAITAIRALGIGAVGHYTDRELEHILIAARPFLCADQEERETMNLEAELKTALATECRKMGAYARRLEDRYAIGLLDLTIKFPGHPHLLAEGKIVEHQSFAPTPRQYEEGKRYEAAGGLCCLIGWDKKTKAMFIHPWAKTATKADSFPPGGGYKAHAETLKDWLDWLAIK